MVVETEGHCLGPPRSRGSSLQSSYCCLLATATEALELVEAQVDLEVAQSGLPMPEH